MGSKMRNFHLVFYKHLFLLKEITITQIYLFHAGSVFSLKVIPLVYVLIKVKSN